MNELSSALNPQPLDYESLSLTPRPTDHVRSVVDKVLTLHNAGCVLDAIINGQMNELSSALNQQPLDYESLSLTRRPTDHVRTCC